MGNRKRSGSACAFSPMRAAIFLAGQGDDLILQKQFFALDVADFDNVRKRSVLFVPQKMIQLSTPLTQGFNTL